MLNRCVRAIRTSPPVAEEMTVRASTLPVGRGQDTSTRAYGDGRMATAPSGQGGRFAGLGGNSEESFGPERYRVAFEDSAIGMAIEGLDGRWLRVNPALCTMLGYTSDQLLTMSYQDVCLPEDLEDASYLESLNNGTVLKVMRECRYRRADGTTIWVRVHVGVIREGGATQFYAIQIEDITDRKAAESRLAHEAAHDALTGLPNRHAFAERVAAVLDGGNQPALLFIDLDRFKLVNDTLGHPAGDELLIAVARRLRSSTRGSEVVARTGGDEFVVLADPATSLAGAERLAQRLQAALAAPFQISGRSLFLTASIGIAVAGSEMASAEDTMRDADLAMYRAKATGKARTVVFDASLRRESERRLAIEQDLRRAVADPRQLDVWFQPVVSTATGRVVAAEALVRWQHPQRGLLLPAEFLPIAEEVGLMGPIGRIVLGKALRHARRWRDIGLSMGGIL